jgi:hypothetical protein
MCRGGASRRSSSAPWSPPTRDRTHLYTRRKSFSHFENSSWNWPRKVPSPASCGLTTFPKALHLNVHGQLAEARRAHRRRPTVRSTVKYSAFSRSRDDREARQLPTPREVVVDEAALRCRRLSRYSALGILRIWLQAIRTTLSGHTTHSRARNCGTTRCRSVPVPPQWPTCHRRRDASTFCYRSVLPPMRLPPATW